MYKGCVKDCGYRSAVLMFIKATFLLGLQVMDAYVCKTNIACLDFESITEEIYKVL